MLVLQLNVQARFESIGRQVSAEFTEDRFHDISPKISPDISLYGLFTYAFRATLRISRVYFVVICLERGLQPYSGRKLRFIASIGLKRVES